MRSPPRRVQRLCGAVDPSAIIDRQPIGRLQLTTFALCFATTFFDGYDIQAMALAAPFLVKQWGVSASAFGPIFSAALAGFMVGQLLFGRTADRVGRRITLIGAVLIFSTFTLACAFATDWWSLLLLRFAVGIGLGGAMPIVLALTAELAPLRARSFTMGIVSSGYCLGAIAGGFLASLITEDGHWQGMFLAGGLGPLILCAIMFLLLSESPAYLVQAARYDELMRVMKRISPREVDERTIFGLDIEPQGTKAVSQLFSRDHRQMTVALWATYFLVIISSYCMASWLPLLMTERGHSVQQAAWTFIAFNAGGGIGGVAIGRIIDRLRPVVVLSAAYLIGAGLFIVAGASAAGWPAMPILMGAAGFFVIGGGQLGLAAYATSLYPATLRSTAMGAALAFGRIGGIVGPLLGGAVLAAQLPGIDVFTVVGLLGLLTALVVLKLHPRSERHATPHSA